MLSNKKTKFLSYLWDTLEKKEFKKCLSKRSEESAYSYCFGVFATLRMAQN